MKKPSTKATKMKPPRLIRVENSTGPRMPCITEVGAIATSRWQRVRTCNLGVWMDDFRRVRGFDETFEGWGFEDSDLAVRLLNAGVRRKEGAFATGVLHLWHRENDRKHEGRNWELLQQRIRAGDTLPAKGLADPS